MANSRHGGLTATAAIVMAKALGKEPHMEPKAVEKLEEKIEEAIAEVVVKMGLKKLPLMPSSHTSRMMAKAVVAVYEAVADSEK